MGGAGGQEGRAADHIRKLHVNVSRVSRMMPADSYSRRVLVLDGIPETVEVLQAVLQPRGIHVVRESSRSGHSPSGVAVDVLVVHRGERAGAPHEVDLPQAIPQIIVDDELDARDGPCPANRLRSPFDYGDLVREIEELLDGGDAAL